MGKGVREDCDRNSPQSHCRPRKPKQRPGRKHRQHNCPVLKSEQPQIPPSKVPPFKTDEGCDKRTKGEPEEPCHTYSAENGPCKFYIRRCANYADGVRVDDPIQDHGRRIGEVVAVRALPASDHTNLNHPRRYQRRRYSGTECDRIVEQHGCSDCCADSKAETMPRRCRNGDERDGRY